MPSPRPSDQPGASDALDARERLGTKVALSRQDHASQAPLVSIIVPNYNHARFLKERFSSILNQTWRDYELIILDDASLDNSLILIKSELADIPHTLITNSVNSGSPCSQWLRGIEQSRGKYIWIAESDDSCAPDFLINMLALMDDNISLAYSRSKAIDDSSHTIDEAGGYWPDQLDPTRFKSAFTMANQDFCSHYLIDANVIPNASAVLFHRDQGLATGQALAPNLERLLYAGDWLFWFHYLANNNGFVAFSAQQDSWFRHHHTSTRSTSSSASQEARHIDEYCQVIQLISCHPIHKSRLGLRQRALHSGWDWMYLEYLYRCQPSLAARLRGAGLHGPLARLFPLRLMLSSLLRRHFFPGLFGWTQLAHQRWQTRLAQLKHLIKSKLL